MAYRALCARCAKSRPFSTTGRQFFGCRIAAGVLEYPQDNFIVYIALFWTLDNSQNTTRLNFGLLNCSCMLLEVAGFQGCYRGKHRNNWRCARAVRKRPHRVNFHLNPHSSDFGDVCAFSAPFLHQLTMQSSLFEPVRPVSVVVCVARKPRPCPSYSRRRDRINLGLWRSLYKGGGVS